MEAFAGLDLVQSLVLVKSRLSPGTGSVSVAQPGLALILSYFSPASVLAQFWPWLLLYVALTVANVILVCIFMW